MNNTNNNCADILLFSREFSFGCTRGIVSAMTGRVMSEDVG